MALRRAVAAQGPTRRKHVEQKKKIELAAKKTDNESGYAGRPDVVHLVRSIQRLEGQPDCFGRAGSNCSPQCPWRNYCLVLSTGEGERGGESQVAKADIFGEGGK
ncbi:MAG: hypothetical protein U5R30_20230 [Deltaproteobacteria bacterium]|nr:hypothetical protein [Deltaproteobacteria bacterium]